MTGSPRRALAAAGLLAAVLAALLGAWFVSGWAGVRDRQRVVRDAPGLAAEQRAGELAHELRGELAQLIAREVERPYFHYQNLFHDPRASAVSVAPSPLAQGARDPLVLGHFQLDAGGRVTTPTINDELPQLSEPTRLADHRRFRDEVTRSFAGELGPRGGPRVAALSPAPATATPQGKPPSRSPGVPRARPEPAQPAIPPAAAQVTSQDAPPSAPPAPEQTQVVTIDPSSYAQNAMPNHVYAEQRREPLPNGDLRAGVPGPSPLSADPRTGVPSSPLPSADPRAGVPDPSPPSADPRVGVPGPSPSSDPRAGVPSSPPSSAEPSVGVPGPSPSAESRAGVPNSPPPSAEPRAGVPSSPPGAVASPGAIGASRSVGSGTSSRSARSAVPAAIAAAGADPAQAVTITVSPLEWRTLPFAGQPALVAVRQVETPDGRLAQGFVVDRTALTGWLAGHAGDAVAQLRTGDGGAEIAPGWHLEVAPNPHAVVAAAVDATALARSFVLRFLAIGLLAVLVAVSVVMLVARAERLARERSQFAAAAAHELRTPLAGLQLYGDMIADGLGDPAKLRDYARRMSEEAARLGRVVSNVLGFSQLQRGNLSVDTRVASLGASLRELADAARPALDRAGAALALDVDPALSARFDRDAVARIVGNLLDNAEKYSRDAADRTIELAARAAGAVIEVLVTDHGPGIPARARPRLFRPFARGVTSDGPAGLGLGLALSQSLARAMGGELGHRPPPAGAGTCFVLTLPRA